MTPDFDIIIVGSGPAGVSAAFPLVEAGIRVLMVDGGRKPDILPPEKDFLSVRANDDDQWKWMLGKDFHALKMYDTVSPKLRVPSLAYVFEQFESENRIVGEDFVTIGSLATGGLSNAWGCGVARFSGEELESFPFPASELDASSADVALRMGISGGVGDDLSDFFGLDEWTQPPIDMDRVHSYLLNRYTASRSKLAPLGFKTGRARIAVISQDRGDRQACNLSGNCMWGCSRRALYSAADELDALRKYGNFTLQSGFVVDSVSSKDGLRAIKGKSVSEQAYRTISAKKILLAAGTLATTRLTLQALGKYEEEVPLLSCPTAAFMLWVPRFLGVRRMPAIGIGQLAFTLSLAGGITAYGANLATTGIGMSEFLRRAPLKRPNGIELFRNLLSSCLIGGLFLPGNLTRARACLRKDDSLHISGQYLDSATVVMNEAETKLRKSYSKLGAMLIPKSFTTGSVGGDIHYAGTIPMKSAPSLGESTALGEVKLLDDVHVIDGACIPSLPGKPHTFMIMANADRIAREIAGRFKSSNS